jgi:ribulose-5-phosphate 4-epimerase/fuculose-1-phosphate aldolase
LTLELVNKVNEIRPVQSRALEALAPEKVRNELVEGLRLAMELELGAGVVLEASIRLRGTKVLTAPARAWPPSLKGKELVVSSVDTQWSTDRESLPPHFDWHVQVYRHTDARAVLFCQPPHALLLSSFDHGDAAALPKSLLQGLGGMLTIDPDQIASAANSNGVLHLAATGMLVHGRDLNHTLERAEAAAHVCKILVLRRLIEK